jgi:hypothetical protein
MYLIDNTPPPTQRFDEIRPIEPANISGTVILHLESIPESIKDYIKSIEVSLTGTLHVDAVKLANSRAQASTEPIEKVIVKETLTLYLQSHQGPSISLESLSALPFIFPITNKIPFTNNTEYFTVSYVIDACMYLQAHPDAPSQFDRQMQVLHHHPKAKIITVKSESYPVVINLCAPPKSPATSTPSKSTKTTTAKEPQRKLSMTPPQPPLLKSPSPSPSSSPYFRRTSTFSGVSKDNLIAYDALLPTEFIGGQDTYIPILLKIRIPRENLEKVESLDEVVVFLREATSYVIVVKVTDQETRQVTDSHRRVLDQCTLAKDTVKVNKKIRKAIVSNGSNNSNGNNHPSNSSPLPTPPSSPYLQTSNNLNSTSNSNKNNKNENETDPNHTLTQTTLKLALSLPTYTHPANLFSPPPSAAAASQNTASTSNNTLTSISNTSHSNPSSTSSSSSPTSPLAALTTTTTTTTTTIASPSSFSSTSLNNNPGGNPDLRVGKYVQRTHYVKFLIRYLVTKKSKLRTHHANHGNANNGNGNGLFYIQEETNGKVNGNGSGKGGYIGSGDVVGKDGIGNEMGVQSRVRREPSKSFDLHQIERTEKDKDGGNGNGFSGGFNEWVQGDRRDRTLEVILPVVMLGSLPPWMSGGGGGGDDGGK